MTTKSQQVVVGIDLGTQGVRSLAVTPSGAVSAASHIPLPGTQSDLTGGWFEQSPQDWWQTVLDSLRNLAAQLSAGVSFAGVCVVSTSGTVLPVDAQGEALHPAVMYNDRRSEAQVIRVQEAAADHQSTHGFMFGSSYGLTKIAWFKEERPEIFERTRYFVHAADYIAGKLCGSFGISDTSNALKTGYDLVNLRWPDFIEQGLGIPRLLLPEVVIPGTVIGKVTRQAAQVSHLPPGTPVMAGATDGTAAQIASGASQPGDWNSTLGTTLVLKGITEQLVIDPLGRVYSHRHPSGWWMPGGASNTGAEWITKEHPQADPATLDQQASDRIPTSLVRYPLVKRGERFPFLSKTAAGFILGEAADVIDTYAAGLEGVALLERLAYEMVAGLGLPVGPRVYTTGGGSRSNLWNRIRASVLDRTLVSPLVTESAMGAAVLAASGCWTTTLPEAAAAMITTAELTDPEPAWQAVYAEKYNAFKNELSRRGLLPEESQG